MRLVGMLRQSVFGRLAGYEDVNDVERLRHDPAMRWIIGGKAAKGRAASPSQMGRFETRWLAAPENLRALGDLSGRWIDAARRCRSGDEVILDMDSSVSPTHGDQEGSIWNGHFACTCYHPLFIFNQFGDLERCALRRGNVHSADGWEPPRAALCTGDGFDQCPSGGDADAGDAIVSLAGLEAVKDRRTRLRTRRGLSDGARRQLRIIAEEDVGKRRRVLRRIVIDRVEVLIRITEPV